MRSWDDRATVRGRAGPDARVMASHRPSNRIAAPSFLLAIALVVGVGGTDDRARRAADRPAGGLGGSGDRSARPATARDRHRPDRAARPGDGSSSVRRPNRPSRPVAEVRAPVAVPDAKPQVVSKSTTSFGRARPPRRTSRAATTCGSRRSAINRSVTGSRAAARPTRATASTGGAARAATTSTCSVTPTACSSRSTTRTCRGACARAWRSTTRAATASSSATSCAGGRSRRPTNGAWAYAGQSRPSMTLQTCVGARSQFRLIVRLVRRRRAAR